MRHRKSGVKLNRTTSHRQAMFRNMVTSLLKHDRIQTTETKAKELRRWADHIITLAKRGDLHALRQALSIVREKEVVYKVFEKAKDRFGDIPGGYTRMCKIGRRPGDSAPMMLIELVNAKTVKPSSAKKSAGTPASTVKSEIPAAPVVTEETAPVSAEPVSAPDMTAEAEPASDETGPAETESMAAAAEVPAAESPETPAEEAVEAQSAETDVPVSNASDDAPDAAAGEAKKEEQ